MLNDGLDWGPFLAPFSGNEGISELSARSGSWTRWSRPWADASGV